VFEKETKTLSDTSFTQHIAGTSVILISGIASNFDAQWRRHGWVAKLEAAGRTVIA